MRIVPPLLRAMSVIESLQRNVNYMSENKFRVDEFIHEPKIDSLKLSGFGLQNSDLEELTPHLLSLESLRHLDLSDNDFTRVPEEFNQLSSLESLNLENNRLIALLEKMDGLVSLEELLLGQNSFEELPISIGSLPSLQVLEADRNQLKTLPEEIGDLKSLKTLKLWGNQIRELPASIGKLKKLNSLMISYNQLRSFPEEIAQLRQLVALRAERNLLNAIPDEFSNLKSLEQLNLWGNLIENVTPEIGKLKRLQKLVLDDNRISTLPESIAKIDTLEVLEVDGNPLATFPEEMDAAKGIASKKEDRMGEDVCLDTPYAEILHESKSKIDALISRAAIPTLALESPLFDSQKQVSILAHELEIISKFKDESNEIFKEKLSAHAELFLKELERGIGIILSDVSNKNQNDLNLAKFFTPKNLAQKSKQKMGTPTKNSIKRKPGGPNFKL